MEAEQNIEQEVATEEIATQSPLGELLNKLNTRDEVVADADPTEEIPEAEAEVAKAEEEITPAKVEGPSVAMKALARQQGLSDKLIATATSDEQLEAIVAEFTSREEKPAPEPFKVPEMEMMLPDEDFPADDPVRKQFVAAKDFVKQETEAIYGYLGQMADMVLELNKAHEENKTNHLKSVEGTFDSHLDEYDNPVLGLRKSGELESRHQTVRQAIYNEYMRLKEERPQAADASLIDEAASVYGYKPKADVRKAAIRQESNRRLGGGQSPPLPEKQPTGRDRFRAVLAEINSRPHNKES